jgi:5-methyltetrahydrofolate--homocysteine methyltransferase
VLDSGISVMSIIDDGLIPGMNKEGRRFRENVYYIPDVFVSARAMKVAMAPVRPSVGRGRRGLEGSSCARYGLHDIGKNLVGVMLVGAGYDVHDLGVGVSPETFLKCVEETGAGHLCMSALLITTMPSLELTINAAKEAELRNKV